MFSGRVLNATRRSCAGARCGELRAGQDPDNEGARHRCGLSPGPSNSGVRAYPLSCGAVEPGNRGRANHLTFSPQGAAASGSHGASVIQCRPQGSVTTWPIKRRIPSPQLHILPRSPARCTRCRSSERMNLSAAWKARPRRFELGPIVMPSKHSKRTLAARKGAGRQGLVLPVATHWELVDRTKSFTKGSPQKVGQT